MATELNGPYTPTVGIRQVTHNGVLLPAAMRLEITGGTVETITADDGVKTYKLDLTTTLAALTARVAVLEALIGSDGSVTRLKNPQGDVVLVAGQFAGDPTLKFYQDSAPAQRSTVSLSSLTLAADLTSALAGAGLVVANP